MTITNSVDFFKAFLMGMISPEFPLSSLFHFNKKNLGSNSPTGTQSNTSNDKDQGDCYNE